MLFLRALSRLKEWQEQFFIPKFYSFSSTLIREMFYVSTFRGFCSKVAIEGLSWSMGLNGLQNMKNASAS